MKKNYDPKSRCHSGIRQWVFRLTLLVLVPASSLLGGPNDREPQKPLEPVGVIAQATPWIVEATNECRRIEKEMAEFHDPSNLKAPNAAQKLGKLRYDAYFHEYHSHELQWMNEPAGYDLAPQFNVFQKKGLSLGSAVTSTPAGAKYATRQLQQIQKDASKRLKLIESSTKLLQQGKSEAAFKALEKYNLDLVEQSTFQAAAAWTMTQPYWNHVAVVRGKYQEFREEQFGQAYAAALDKEGKRFESAKAGLERLAQPSGEGSEKLTLTMVSDGISNILRGWRATNAIASRYQGIARAWKNSASPRVSEPPLNDAELTQSVISAMTALIDRSKQDLAPEERNEAYLLLLPMFSELGCHLRDPTALAPCLQAIQGLAQESPEFTQQVVTYNQATRELLRWREMQAADWVKRRREADTTGGALLAAERAATATLRPELFGGMNTRAVISASPTIISPVHWQLSESASRLAAKHAYVEHVVPMSAESPVSVSRLVAGADGKTAVHYAMMQSAAFSQPALDQLRSDLLIGPDAPPLTYNASVAFESAKRGCLTSAGGKVFGLAMEPLLSRIAAMPSAATVVLPLDQPATSATELFRPGSEPVTQLIWRLDMQLDWKATKYAFEGS